MPNTKDQQKQEPIPRILLIGDSGTHKTFFGANIPGAYFFDFDVGLAIARQAGLDVEYDSFKDAPKGGRKDPDNGIYQHGTAWPKFIAKLNQVGIKIDKDEWRNEDGSLRPIIIDSLTTMANSAMAYVLDQTGHDGNPQIQHWGAQMNLIETTMDQLNSWPVPLVVTSHIQRATNDLTQVIEYLPLVTGKLAGKLPLYFDEVYYTMVTGKGEDKTFTLKTESDMMYKQAKTRYGVKDGTETSYAAVVEQIRNPKKWGKK